MAAWKVQEDEVSGSERAYVVEPAVKALEPEILAPLQERHDLVANGKAEIDRPRSRFRGV